MIEAGAPVPTVKSARLELQILQESYLDDYHAIWTNPKVTVWTTRGPSKSLEDSRVRMASLLSDIEKPESLNFGVFIQSTLHTPSSDTNQMIGVVGVFRTSIAREAEVGYAYNESFWGQGYASEALAAYVNAYWDRVKTVDAMVAMVDSENTASINVLKRCGFVGQNAWWIISWCRRDTVVFSSGKAKCYIDRYPTTMLTNTQEA